jgi:hypothetical protein
VAMNMANILDHFALSRKFSDNISETRSIRTLIVIMKLVFKRKDIFFLWLCSPILGLGRLHETLRFISVIRSRTVSSTP